MYDFLVPEPIEEVPPIYPPPEDSKKRGLKRKREFTDEFWVEKKKVAIESLSEDEDDFTKEEWKVAKFTDRHNDVRAIISPSVTNVRPVRHAVLGGAVADWRNDVGARARDQKE